MAECTIKVYIRDMMRYTGRGSGGFQMHYTERTCKRLVRTDQTACWQHKRLDDALRAAPNGDGASVAYTDNM